MEKTRLMGLSECEKLFKVNKRTIQRWAEDVPEMRSTDGVYDALEIALYMIGELNKPGTTDKKSNEMGQLAIKKMKAQVKLLEREAALKDLDLKERKGTLVVYAKINREYTELVTRARQRLLPLAKKLCNRLSIMTSVPEIEHLLANEIHEALVELGGGVDDGEPDI